MNKKFFSQRPLSLAFIASMLMVGSEVEPWVALFSIGLLIWKWGAETLGWKSLSRKFTGALSILLLGQVLFQYRTLIGQEPSYTFLLGLSALRVMDYGTDRDHKFLVLLGFILLSVKALFSLDIYWILPSGLAFAGLWYSLLPSDLPRKARLLRNVFTLSIPGAFLLFFAFPRFVLPWAMQRGSSYGQVGFSDELNPGQVAGLVSSDNMVFRARLSNLPLHETQDLYWKGSTLTQSRGLSWRPSRSSLQKPVPSRNDSSYEVILEPQGGNFLFTLDGTREVQLENGRVLPLEGFVFRTVRPSQNTLVYRGSWQSDFQDRTPPDEDFLQTPEFTGKVLEWIETTKKQNASPEQRLEALQKFFSKGFRYTLNPGAYGTTGTELESFLFHRKRGFCEHFAGSYATLARALGIPAKVVVGYQGGRHNPFGDYWRVSQKDAHAWVEIFHNDRWTRIDPTGWVAPLRLFIGAETFFALSETEQVAFARDIKWRPDSQRNLLWDRMTLVIDDLNYRWTYFLIDFDRTAQMNFWRELGSHLILLLLGGGFVLILSFLLFRNLLRSQTALAPEQKLLYQVFEWGRQQEVPIRKAESPLSYLSRLAESFPQRKDLLNDISQFYDQKVYAGSLPTTTSEKVLLRKWRKQVRHLSKRSH